MKEKILIYGGTFNPIHKGHTHILKHFIDAINPDKVLLIPTGDPPHKTSPDLASANDRINMCKLALEEENINGEVSNIETSSKEKSYTFSTLLKLREKYPYGEFYLCMGEDMFTTLYKWYKPEIILKEAIIVGAKRSFDAEARLNEAMENLKKDYPFFKGFIVDIPYFDASSTEVRIGTFDYKREKLSEKVFEYIYKNSLYKPNFKSNIPDSEECKNLIKPFLKEKRYSHSLCVAKKAKELSIKYGENIEKAEIAALLHDIMKDTSLETQLKILKYSAIMLSATEKNSPAVMHQFSGAAILKDYFKIADEEIINAVRNHTTGREAMTKLEKIIFIADAISEDRNYPTLNKIKEASEISLEEAIFVNTQSIINDFSSKGLAIVESTVYTYNYYLNHK